MTWFDRLLGTALVLLLAAAGSVASLTAADSYICGSVLDPSSGWVADDCLRFIENRRELAIRLVVLAAVSLVGALLLARRATAQPERTPDEALPLLGLLVPVAMGLVLIWGAESNAVYTGLTDELRLAAAAAAVLLLCLLANRLGLRRRLALSAAAGALPLTWALLYASDVSADRPLAEGEGGGFWFAAGVPLAVALTVACRAQREYRVGPPALTSWLIVLGGSVLAVGLTWRGALPGTSAPDRGLVVLLLSAAALPALAGPALRMSMRTVGSGGPHSTNG